MLNTSAIAEMPEKLHLTIVRNVAELERFASAWQDLLAQTPTVSAFQSFAWIQSYLNYREAIGNPVALGVAVVTVHERVVAIFPMQRSAQGNVSFVAGEVSNYSGPIYNPYYLEAATEAWLLSLTQDPSIHALELGGIREGSPFLEQVKRIQTIWGEAKVVETAVCPEVNLSKGWDAIYSAQKSKRRTYWKKQWRSLESLGNLEFVEHCDAQGITNAFPKMFELFDSRWEGKRIDASFSESRRLFQVEAARSLATANHARLSLLCLDGVIIAFNYNLSAGDATTSYVVGYDKRFDLYSPGHLLLQKILEQAAARNEAYYDFSLGEASYKAMWASQERRVYRLLWGKGRLRKYALAQLWIWARAQPFLRKLKQDGLRGFLYKPSPSQSFLWNMYRINPASSAPQGKLTLAKFREIDLYVPNELQELALDRHFRGDSLYIVMLDEKPYGLIWKASLERAKALVGADVPIHKATAVFYHPIILQPDGSLENIVNSVEGGDVLLVACETLTNQRMVAVAAFTADINFKRD